MIVGKSSNSITTSAFVYHNNNKEYNHNHNALKHRPDFRNRENSTNSLTSYKSSTDLLDYPSNASSTASLSSLAPTHYISGTSTPSSPTDGSMVVNIRSHYRPIHTKSSSSILSRDARLHGPSYAGFQNLAMIVLAIGNLRILIEDYTKYGFFRSFYRLGLTGHDLKLWGILTALVPVHLFIALVIERLASTVVSTENRNSKLLQRLILALHLLNACLVLYITSFTVYFKIWHPVVGTICQCHCLVVCLKVSSFALANRDLRSSYLDKSDASKQAMPDLYQSCPYPKNLALSNLVYFWWAPTLVYQPVYPRTESIRFLFLGKRLFEIIGSVLLIWFLSSQYAIPILEDR